MEVKDYAKVFQEAFELTQNQEASLEIVRQIAIDNRQKANDKPKNADMPLRPATDKQKRFLDTLKVKYPENISSIAASRLIEEHK